MLVDFAMACGPTNTVPAANVWTVGNYWAAPGQVNAVAATSDVFRLTGVVVLPGIEAPSAARAPLIMRPFDQELLTCKRYFEMINPGSVAQGSGWGTLQSVSVATLFCPLSVTKRAAPSVPAITGTYFVSGVSGAATGTATAITSTPDRIMWSVTGVTPNGSVGQPVSHNGFVIADARL
jgi:hypothetical protein